jgi:hypothetical protein
LEGDAFGLRHSLELMKTAGLEGVDQVRVTAVAPRGRSGAPLLAATGVGTVPDVDAACAVAVRVTGCTEPGEAAAAHQDLYPLCRNLHPALRPTLAALGTAI